MDQYPVLSCGPTPSITNPCRAGFVSNLMIDLIAPALSQKPLFITNFVARGAPRPCYKAEGFDPLPHIYICISFIFGANRNFIAEYEKAEFTSNKM